jgi:hypothetical protein
MKKYIIVAALVAVFFGVQSTIDAASAETTSNTGKRPAPKAPKERPKAIKRPMTKDGKVNKTAKVAYVNNLKKLKDDKIKFKDEKKAYKENKDEYDDDFEDEDDYEIDEDLAEIDRLIAEEEGLEDTDEDYGDDDSAGGEGH